ncbi:MAG: hypothetical protein H7230_02340 [Candidatus Parcubacteria bacterium]|nr:hypothetical protein [Candidatus Paceibacterota bacterium]
MPTNQTTTIEELISNIQSILERNEDNLELLSLDEDDKESYPVIIRENIVIKRIELSGGEIKCYGTNSGGNDFEELLINLNYGEIAEIYFFIKNEIIC